MMEAIQGLVDMGLTVRLRSTPEGVFKCWVTNIDTDPQEEEYRECDTLADALDFFAEVETRGIE